MSDFNNNFPRSKESSDATNAEMFAYVCEGSLSYSETFGWLHQTAEGTYRSASVYAYIFAAALAKLIKNTAYKELEGTPFNIDAKNFAYHAEKFLSADGLEACISLAEPMVCQVCEKSIRVTYDELDILTTQLAECYASDMYSVSVAHIELTPASVLELWIILSGKDTRSSDEESFLCMAEDIFYELFRHLDYLYG